MRRNQYFLQGSFTGLGIFRLTYRPSKPVLTKFLLFNPNLLYQNQVVHPNNIWFHFQYDVFYTFTLISFHCFFLFGNYDAPHSSNLKYKLDRRCYNKRSAVTEYSSVFKYCKSLRKSILVNINNTPSVTHKTSLLSL